MAGIRVAEPEVEAVVGREGLEGFGGAHLAAHPAADAGGVVEDDAGGHAGEELEHVLEPLADALGVLRGEHLGDADVGEREGQDEEAGSRAHAQHVEVGLAEVRLGYPRGPVEVEELLVVGDSALPAQHRHVLADAGLGYLRALLLRQPAPDLPRRVALLAPALPVLVEPALYERAVLVELGLPLPLRGHLGGEIVEPQVLVHGVAAYAGHPRDFGHGHPLPPHASYIIGFGHADHFPSGLLGRHRQNSNC